jgi:hypothetical protein
MEIIAPLDGTLLLIPPFVVGADVQLGASQMLWQRQATGRYDEREGCICFLRNSSSCVTEQSFPSWADFVAKVS